MSQLNDVQLAFLFGFANGYHYARMDLQQEADNLMGKLKEEVQTELRTTRAALARLDARSRRQRH